MKSKEKNVIEIRNLSVIQNGKAILSDINFSIGQGEKILVRGESGSGKSTLIKSILFFVRFAGEILFSGQTVGEHNLFDYRSRIGYIGQQTPHLNLKIRDFLRMPFGYRANHPMKPDPNKIAGMLNDLHFDSSVMEKNFNDLSGGEKQRLMILQVMLLEKPVYLFDEVTSALDEKNIESAIGLMTRNRKQTVVSISHNRQWEPLCDRILVIKAGKIIREKAVS